MTNHVVLQPSMHAAMFTFTTGQGGLPNPNSARRSYHADPGNWNCQSPNSATQC